MIRHRAVALADLSSLAFFGGFGALVLGGVLFLTGVWHESVLRPASSSHPARCWPVSPRSRAACSAPGSGTGPSGPPVRCSSPPAGVWWITHVGATPDWAGAYLPGSLLGGLGVGLMLPSLGGAATAPLPPQRFATGSALYAMTRQIGIALGVACLVAILGTATGATAVGLPPRLGLHDRLQPGRRPAAPGHRQPCDRDGRCLRLGRATPAGAGAG